MDSAVGFLRPAEESIPDGEFSRVPNSPHRITFSGGTQSGDSFSGTNTNRFLIVIQERRNCRQSVLACDLAKCKDRHLQIQSSMGLLRICVQASVVWYEEPPQSSFKYLLSTPPECLLMALPERFLQSIESFPERIDGDRIAGKAAEANQPYDGAYLPLLTKLEKGAHLVRVQLPDCGNHFRLTRLRLLERKEGLGPTTHSNVQ